MYDACVRQTVVVDAEISFDMAVDMSTWRQEAVLVQIGDFGLVRQSTLKLSQKYPFSCHHVPSLIGVIPPAL